MALKDYIDKDTRNFLIILAGLAIFMFFIFPRIENQLFTLNASDPIKPLFPQINPTPVVQQRQVFALERGKDYKLDVSTSMGNFTVDLNEGAAPDNVANVISLAPQYRNSPILISKDYLFKIDSQSDVQYSVNDEINADFLLLDKTKVRDASYLRNAYDPNDPATNVFEPNNLRKYEDFTVKQFYQEVLGYNYSSSLSTPRAVKYTVYMASTGSNQNKVDFFVLMANNAPEVDGRYTPIGRISEGFTTLDNINNAQSGVVRVNSVTVRS